MLDPALGAFDFVVAMDSLIHYRAVRLRDCACEPGAAHAARSILFTFAPRTPALAAMHAVGRLFPRKDRAPAIEPVPQDDAAPALGSEPALRRLVGRRARERIVNGFYTRRRWSSRKQ